MLSLAQFTEHSLSWKEYLEYVLLVFTAVHWLCYGTGRQNNSLFKSQKVKKRCRYTRIKPTSGNGQL